MKENRTSIKKLDFSTALSKLKAVLEIIHDFEINLRKIKKNVCRKIQICIL